ncbi:MAG: hypothetical protein QF535_09095, partial [Anaerolineales bacterium]|nr:hypothetical protein [Anaerolineales bacterium]
IDGTALTPASFGETNSATNQWKPIEYTGSYGTNGFYLDFSNTTLPTYTVPSATFSDDGNTRLLINSNTSNGSTTFTDTSGTSTISVFGATQHSTAQKKWGASSILLDGNDDSLYLSTGTLNSTTLQLNNYTYECWTYANSYCGHTYFFSGSGSQTYLGLSANVNATGSTIQFGGNSSGSGTGAVPLPGAGTWPLNQWVHLAMQRDSSGLLTILFNGQVLNLGGGPSTGFDSNGNGLAAWPFAFGAQNFNGGSHRYSFDGYLDDIRVSNTQRYTAAYGLSATLGTDNSGNTNHFSPINLVATDQVIDTPQNSTGGNFCTLNPNYNNSQNNKNYTLSEGNTKISITSHTQVNATMGVDSGKWY